MNLTLTPTPDYKVGDIIIVSGLRHKGLNGEFVVTEIGLCPHANTTIKKKTPDRKYYLKFSKRRVK